MPFKSKAQRRKFAELLVKGEISEETFEEWNRETGSAKLPERVKAAKKRGSQRNSAKRSGKSKTSAKAKSKARSATKRPARRKSA
jgi:RPA family protein